MIMNLIKSIFSYSCPHCRKGKLFKEPFDFFNPLAMHKHCSHCNQDFEPEPGFYFGAMFISYGLGVFYLLIPALLLTLLWDWSVSGAMTFIILIAAISFFRVLRLSRSIWIHIAVRYNKKFDSELGM